MADEHIKLSAEQWQLVLEALPELADVRDYELIRDQFNVIRYDNSGIIPTDGMYVVLSGTVSIQLNDTEVTRATAADYFFEEYLTLDEIGVSIAAHAAAGCVVARLAQDSWKTLATHSREDVMAFLFGDLVNVHMHDFQQPINCCNITAAALSLSALGYPTHVDDIFRDCSLPAAYVVNTGLTLGEMYDVSCTYIHRRGLSEEIHVQCHYFDAELTSEQDLIKAIEESDDLGGEQDILVANFGVGTAHGNPSMGGGHFALIAKCNSSTGLVHMIDVHPEKYGKLWVTTVRRLYESMVERDGSSMRARGMIRFTTKEAMSTRLSTFHREVIAVDMTRHLDISRKKIASFFQRSTTNLRGLGALSLSIRLMGHTDVDPDELMRAANLSHSEALSFVPSPGNLARTAQNYMSHVGSEALICRALTYSSDDAAPTVTAEDWLLTHLKLLKGDQHIHFVVNVDINKVLGCAAIAMPNVAHRESVPLTDFWCVCTDFNAEDYMVTLTDVSSMTPQVWQAPFANLLAGMENRQNPSLVQMTHQHAISAADLDHIVHAHPLVLFHSDDDPWSYMLQSMLSNIGVNDLHSVDISGHGLSSLRLRQQLISESGKDSMPYLYFQGRCLGETAAIVGMIRSGDFQEMLLSEGLHVLSKLQTPSLDNNIFGYPKGGLTDAADNRKNILLCACGSSAADKIPQLIELFVAAGHDVKLVPSKSAEHFFKDFGMSQILNSIKPSDIYRDDDEWNFRYEEFGMPVRAAHLALCDWADCVVVSPVTCNSMGKIANGVADSMLTSVFVAWQYQRKPVILCPACNTHMWNNITTQNNVAQLKRLGAHFEGPRSGLLSNGTTGTGMMALPEEILAAVEAALDDLDNQEARIMRWGVHAAAADDHREWQRIYRSIDEDVVGINIRSDETGDTLLHYAAGGEGEALEGGIQKGVPDIEAAKQLIARGIDLDMVNDYQFTALHVAIMNDSVEMVALLLDAGADASDCVAFVHAHSTDDRMMGLIEAWAVEHDIDPNQAEPEVEPAPKPEAEILYFTYGSLKQGFPNHIDHADVLHDFVGAATTRQAFPLIVPHEPNCSNPECPYLHRMAALVNRKGSGKLVKGEVYRLSADGLAKLDQLEGYTAPEHTDNVYERKTISVLLAGELKTVQVYFIVDAQFQLTEWQADRAASVDEYTLEMAAAVPKPQDE